MYIWWGVLGAFAVRPPSDQLYLLPPVPVSVDKSGTFARRISTNSEYLPHMHPNLLKYPDFESSLPVTQTSQEVKGKTEVQGKVPILTDTSSADAVAKQLNHVNLVPEAEAIFTGGDAAKYLKALKMAGLIQSVNLPSLPSLSLPGFSPDWFKDVQHFGIPDVTIPNMDWRNVSLPVMNVTVPWPSPPHIKNPLKEINITTPDLTVPEFPDLKQPNIEIPDMPDLPKVPDLPKFPTLKDIVPDLPKFPDFPDMPNMPDIPKLPPLPNMPSVPNLDLKAIKLPELPSHLDFKPSAALLAILGVTAELVALTTVLGFAATQKDCASKSANLAKMQMCAMSRLAEASTAFDALYQATSMNVRVLAGGKKAEDALVRMNGLASEPWGRQALEVTGTKLTCMVLASKESVPDHLRWEALSMVTLLSGLPAATNIDAVASGSYGHMNLVMPLPSRVYEPDRAIAVLDAGGSADDLAWGTVITVEGPDSSFNLLQKELETPVQG